MCICVHHTCSEHLCTMFMCISCFTAVSSLHVQVEHNLRKISNSSFWRYEQARLNFWQQCNASFEGDHVDPESAAEFFEVGVA